MQRFALYAPLAAALLLPAPPERGAAQLLLAPEEGLVLVKRGTFGGEVKLTEVAVSVGDEEIEAEAPELTNTFTGTALTTDTYAKVEEGRVLRLERSFDELSQHHTGSSPEGDTETDDESPLQGATVIFAWNEEDEEYRASFGEGGGGGEGEELDAALLEGLDQSLDFELLLPGKEVEEGDVWKLESEDLRAVLSFGGDFHFDDGEEEAPQEKLIDRAFEDDLEGTATCTYRGTRDVDGRELHVIEVVVDGQGHAEEDTEEGDEQVDVDVHRAVDAEMDLEGELLWDAAAGHFAQLSLKGDIGFTVAESATLSFEGETQERSLSMTFGGTLSMEYEAQPE